MPVDGHIAGQPGLVLYYPGLDDAGCEDVHGAEVNDERIADFEALDHASIVPFVNHEPLADRDRSLRGILK
jgi:hypothetical protein